MRKRKIATFYWLLKCVRFHAVLFTYGGIIYCDICLCFVLIAKERSQDQEGFSLPHLMNEQPSLGVLGLCSFMSNQSGDIYVIKYPNTSGSNNGQTISSHITGSLDVGVSRVSDVIRVPGFPSFSSVMLSGCPDPWTWPLRVTRWQLPF